jgi:hypothetical protein
MDNKSMVGQYLDNRKDVDQLCRSSWIIEEVYSRYILLWAGSLPFSSVEKIHPTLPDYHKTARLDGEKDPFSPRYIGKVLVTSCNFYLRLGENYEDYQSSRPTWIRKLSIKHGSDAPVPITSVFLVQK